MHWDSELDARREVSWWSLEQRSRQRLAALVLGEPLGVFGLGRERSVADYAAYIEAQDKVVAALYPAEPVQDSAPESQEPEESTASEAPAESEVQ